MWASWGLGGRLVAALAARWGTERWKLGASPGGNRGTIGRFERCLGWWGGTAAVVGSGGGMISLGFGSQKTRLIWAWPLSMDLRWKLAGLPCLQKFDTWENWCWAKQWAVGVHCAGAILCIGGRDIRSCGPSSCACGRPPPGDEKGLGAFPMPRQRLSPPVSATS